MIILVSPFGFLDRALNNRRECTCSPHSKATEDYKKNRNIYRYCAQIRITLNCLKNLRAKKNCSMDLFTTTLHTGTVWQFKNLNCSAILKRNPNEFTTLSPINSGPNSVGGREGPNSVGDKDSNRNTNGNRPNSHLCVYQNPKKGSEKLQEPLHCGLFGDPHLKTFSDRRQTCVVKGAWSMLNNQFLAVQVTNVLIEENNPVATATSKV